MKIKAYIFIMYSLDGKKLCHSYGNTLEQGIDIYPDTNLGDCIRQLVGVQRRVKMNIVPVVCKYRTFIL